jgi:hypothetical protein
MQGEVKLQEQYQDELLANYFKTLEDAFETACLITNGKEVVGFNLAEHIVLIAIAGKNLKSACRAFSHLTSVPAHESNTLEILVWDEKESSVQLPYFPWLELGIEDKTKVFHISTNNYSVVFLEKKTILHIYHHASNKAIVCIKDAAELPNYFLASPFFKIIQLWSKHVGLDLLHAGCIANNEHAVVFVGKGGKGKSTTSIQCLQSGLNYIGDDYLLIKYAGVSMAYSIYCTGKIHAAQMKKFPEIERISISRNSDTADKPLVYLNELFKDRMISKSPIKALVVPNISSGETRLVSISSFEALMAMAPSTLIQLRLNNENMALSKMAHLTKTVPCYRLDLGANMDHIGTKINNLLNTF